MVVIMGVKFAPLNTPLKRRLQTAAVAQWMISFLVGGYVCFAFMVALLFTRFWWLTILYYGWYQYDKLTPFQGGRRVKFFRNWVVWEYFRDFFPIKLVKTTELDPSKNYLFGCHPHGVLSIGHFSSFSTEALGFSKLFPSITPHLITMNTMFQFPLFREYFSTVGACGCVKSSIEYILTKKGQGNAACLPVGGAQEALEAHPGSYRLILAQKKGFIKLAIQTGACLVPVYSFGENELFKQLPNPEGSKLRRRQKKMTEILGFSLPMFYGRGIFNYSFGLLPFRKPINVVVGEPISVSPNAEPTIAEIDALHCQYLEALERLFESNKERYGIAADQHLQFI